ncbi:hypothetical protein HYT74_01245 [Candidatus Daviesbacteria bacterium]|nr:hypothetical protein [Candidatus Daviesbacteria bacterium]
MILGSYVLLASLVLGLNIIPAFMPPTWTVLAFFVTKYDLLLISVVLIGASCATLGRVVLAGISRKYFRRILSADSQENYASIGEYLNRNRRITIPLVVAYAFLPIPSNDVFIAAGLAKVKIKLLAGSFFVGRLISYTFWVSLTQRFSDNLTDIFSKHYAKTGSIILELVGLLLIYLVGKIAWKKILKKVKTV